MKHFLLCADKNEHKKKMNKSLNLLESTCNKTFGIFFCSPGMLSHEEIFKYVREVCANN